jgi:hypothetical protein
MRAGHHYLARVRAMRSGRIRTMHTTMRQPGGGPASVTTTRCLVRPTTHGACRDCGAPLVWVTRRDGSRLPMNPSPLTLTHEDDAVAVEGEVLVVEGVPHWVTCTGKR